MSHQHKHDPKNTEASVDSADQPTEAQSEEFVKELEQALGNDGDNDTAEVNSDDTRLA